MGEPARRWAYPWWGKVVVSTFVVYHIAAIVVANLPNDPAYNTIKRIAYGLDMSRWIRATGSPQKWDMFAPDPRRNNDDLVVRVESADGSIHTTDNDIRARREWPYLLYDRRGKINRRLLGNGALRRVLAAYHCRAWERSHSGQPAAAVHMVRRRRAIPPPTETARGMSYDPIGLPFDDALLEVLRCDRLEHGQLPPRVRDRLGLSPAPPGAFREVVVQTWANTKPAATGRRRSRVR